MAKNANKNGGGELSFETSIEQLTSIVSKMESGETALEESLKQYEKGMALIKHCREILQKAEEKIEKISQNQQKS